MISTVIPVLNEVDSLAPLYAELAAVARDRNWQWQAIFVDDGSTDGSWAEICRLAAADPRVRGLRLRRNFGKAAALSAGVRAAAGELVVTLDADGQDDPAEIPHLIEALGARYDLVSGWKQARQDPWHKVWLSHIFNGTVSRLSGVALHDHNCGLKCYRSEIFREVRLYGEMHRFLPVLAHARGFRVGEVPVAHRPRRHGHSKYGNARIVKGFLDLVTVSFLTRFGQRPLHLLGSLGLTCLALGGLGMIGVLTAQGIFGQPLALAGGGLLLMIALLASLGIMLCGSQLFGLGLLAEWIVAHQGRDRDAYAIAEETASSDDVAGVERAAVAR